MLLNGKLVYIWLLLSDDRSFYSKDELVGACVGCVILGVVLTLGGVWLYRQKARCP